MPQSFRRSLFHRLILTQGGAFDPEVFKASLQALDDGDFLSTMALGWSTFGWLCALGVTGQRWVLLPVAIDVVLFGLRWRLRRGKSLFPGEAIRPVDDRLAVIFMLQSLIVAIEIYYLASVPSETVVYLALILGMGFAAYVVALQSVFSLLAVFDLLMISIALRLGFGTGYSEAVRPLAVIMPLGTLGFFAMIIRVHEIMLGAIRSQVASQRLSLHDPLTKLANRAYLRQRLDDLLPWVGTERGPASVAVLCLDLDGFKEVNDIYGHAGGDLALIHVAKLLAAEVGVRDMACRIGGDEFVLILIEADAEKLRGLGERIIAGISTPFDIGAAMPVEIGASIGAATAAEPGLDGAALIRRADLALYEAKRHGKGRMHVTDPPKPNMPIVNPDQHPSLFF